MTDLNKIRMAQIRAAEDAVIASLPPELRSSPAAAPEAAEPVAPNNDTLEDAAIICDRRDEFGHPHRTTARQLRALAAAIGDMDARTNVGESPSGYALVPLEAFSAVTRAAPTDSQAGRDAVEARSQDVSTEGEQVAWFSRAVADVTGERRRQIEAEGWTPEHDDEHGDGSMARAAACYALDRASVRAPEWSPDVILWPWDNASWKPRDKRSNLVRAGALILAEIERLDRMAAAGRTPE